MAIGGPGVIEDLVADATAAGHRASTRLVRDWTELGLLDYPERRGAGRGRGSHRALYAENQRHLLLTLLHHRPTNGISSLARIPVGIWMYWGDEFVPLRQARRAMLTWLGDPRVSKQAARETAREVLRQLDNPSATSAARRRLVDELADVAYTGNADVDVLTEAVCDVFEPGRRSIVRAVGHPTAPLTADAMLDLIRARLMAVSALRSGNLGDAAFRRARHAHLVAYAEYAAQQPMLAAAFPDGALLYERATAEEALNSSCGHLLTALGLGILYPEQAARIDALPEPVVALQLP